MPLDTLCPCASGALYAACCGPMLSGQARAMTATALMRSRYTAYVERDTGYLLRTWHPSTRPPALDPATIADWCGLEILRAERGREADDEGIVEFVATARMDDGLGTLHEVSHFVKEAGQWLYVAEERVAAGTPAAARAGKVGRNDRCPCGSGNKYKKCCGR